MDFYDIKTATASSLNSSVKEMMNNSNLIHWEEVNQSFSGISRLAFNSGFNFTLQRFTQNEDTTHTITFSDFHVSEKNTVEDSYFFKPLQKRPVLLGKMVPITPEQWGFAYALSFYGGGCSTLYIRVDNHIFMLDTTKESQDGYDFILMSQCPGEKPSKDSRSVTWDLFLPETTSENEYTFHIRREAFMKLLKSTFMVIPGIDADIELFAVIEQNVETE
jgi:hypothetical protein